MVRTAPPLPTINHSPTIDQQSLSQNLVLLHELCQDEFTSDDYAKCKALTKQVASLTYRRIVCKRPFQIECHVVNKIAQVTLTSRHGCRWVANLSAPPHTQFLFAHQFWVSPSIFIENEGRAQIGVAPYLLAFLGGPLGLLHEIGHLYSPNFTQLYATANRHLQTIKRAIAARQVAKSKLPKATIWGVSERAFLPQGIRNSLNLLDTKSEQDAWRWAVKQAQKLKLEGIDLLAEIGDKDAVSQFIKACVSTHDLSHIRDEVFAHTQHPYIARVSATSKSL